MAAGEQNANEIAHALPCGVYRHYKGNYYLVLGVARHSETDELFAVYVRLYERAGVPISIRPLKAFVETVSDSSGRLVRRFDYVGVQQSDREQD